MAQPLNALEFREQELVAIIQELQAEISSWRVKCGRLETRVRDLELRERELVGELVAGKVDR